MSEPCCSSPGNDEEFTASTAERTARRWRSRGPLPREQAVLRPLLHMGVEGRTVLEVGGGIGQLQLALLDAGAARAVNLELSPHYETVAVPLAAEMGHATRVERRLGDAAHLSEPLPRADVGILFRTVCCTSDWRGMLDAVLDTGVDVLAITMPRGTRLARAAIAVQNTVHRLASRAFRMRHHDPDEVLGHACSTGLTPTTETTSPLWRTVVFTRP